MTTKSFRAVHRYARIAPRKARLVADLVRGLQVDDAMAVLENHPRRAAYLLRKVLKSAMDNASQDVEVNLKGLIVTDARVDMGPLLGFRPPCPRNVRVGANSPSLCPTMSSVMNTFMKRFPLWTMKVCDTNSGTTVQARAQVLMGSLTPESF